MHKGKRMGMMMNKEKVRRESYIAISKGLAMLNQKKQMALLAMSWLCVLVVINS